MKHFLTLLTCLLISHSISAQINERTYGFGFDTYASIIKPISNNRWVVLGHTTPELTGYGQDKDSLFLIILRHDGSLEMKVTLDVQADEKKEVNDLLILPDGDFVVLTASSECDVFGYPNRLQRIKPDGSQVWKISNLSFLDVVAYSIHLASDGNVLAWRGYEVVKFSSATGAILETIPVAVGNQSTYEIAFIPGKEDYIAIGVPDFQYWKKTPVSGGFQYQMSKSADFSDTYHSSLTPAPEGWFYAINRSINVADKNLVRINTGLDYEILTPVLSVDQLVPGLDGLYILEYDDNKENSHLRKTDWLGQTLNEWTIFDDRIRALTVSVRNDSIALAGAENYGKSKLFGSWEASYCWVRTFQGDAPVATGPLYNASITAVEQKSTVDKHVYQGGGGPTGHSDVYSLEGGNFRLQITNNGDTVLQRVFANIRFGRDYSVNICPAYPTHQRLYEGLNLMPGASVWVEFGDIFAPYQFPLPTEFCFWTAAPDERPDYNHSDDHFCHPVKFTSSIIDSYNQAIKVFPNPADDVLEITVLDSDNNNRWHLFDFTGKNVLEGSWSKGQKTAAIQVKELPDGFYTLLAGERNSFKIIVQH